MSDQTQDVAKAPASITKADVLKSLGTIKDALDLELKKKSEEQTRNLEEKIEALKTSHEAAMKLKDDATAAEIEAIKSDALTTQKALDIMQTRMKGQKSDTGSKYQANEDFTLKGQITKGFENFKDNISQGKIAKGDNETRIQVKAVGDMSVAASVTGSYPSTYRNGIVPQPFENIHLRDLVVVTPSATDSYHFYRHNVGEGSINWQVQELATKPQIDEDLSEQTVNLDYLAGWLRISRKMLRNFSGLQAYISRWLPEKYYQAEDTKGYQAILNAATGTQVTGVNMMDTLILTIGSQKKAKYNVTGIVVDGMVWARLLIYKGSTSGEYTMPQGVVTISNTGQLMICGIPVYTASWVGGDEAIIADWKFFEIIQSEGLSLQFFEQDGTNVRENKITARIEASVGFAMLDPRAFVVASLESVS